MRHYGVVKLLTGLVTLSLLPLASIELTAFPSHGWSKIASFVTLYFLGILIGQDGWQRVFTARSVPVARTGGVLVGLYCIGYAAAGALIGAAGRTFLPPLADADLAFAKIVQLALPVGLRGLVLAASLAAIMSTATACLLATSTVFLEDVYLAIKGSSGAGSVAQSRGLTLVSVAIFVIGSALTHFRAVERASVPGPP